MADSGVYKIEDGTQPMRWDNLVHVRFSGPDALEWLQGQVTNDLRQLQPGSPVNACLVKPTGQLLETLTIAQTAEGYEVVSQGKVILERFAEFVIMEEIDLHDLPPVRFLTRTVEPRVPWIKLGDDWLGWTDEPIPGQTLSASELSVLTLENRIAVPLWDAGEKTLPPELGPAFEQLHVAYDKGCYVGQEVLQRIHSRGHVNREWTVLSSAIAAPAGTPVELAGTQVGVVTRSGLSADHGWLVGAMLRTEREGPLSILGHPVGEF